MASGQMPGKRGLDPLLRLETGQRVAISLPLPITVATLHDNVPLDVGISSIDTPLGLLCMVEEGWFGFRLANPCRGFATGVPNRHHRAAPEPEAILPFLTGRSVARCRWRMATAMDGKILPFSEG